MSPVFWPIPYLKTRNVSPELMDDPSLEPEALHAALTGLRRINTVSHVAWTLWRNILADYLRRSKQSSISVIDLGCGSGDVLFGLSRHVLRAGAAFKGLGLDSNPHTVSLANARAEATSRNASSTCSFQLWNAESDPVPENADVIISNLFLHHLSEKVLLGLFRNIQRAAPKLLLISDLTRSPASYRLAQMATKLLSRSRIVHVDGPRSVEAAFTPGELSSLAATAGLTGAKVDRIFPLRMLLKWQPEFIYE